MDSSHEIAQLKAQVDQLTAENAALREDGFRGSKAEALMALMIVVPLILVAVTVFGGLYAYRDHQQQVESHAAMDRVANEFQTDPAFKPHK
jgi:cell division protein FtsB